MNPAEAAAEFIEDVLYSQEANDDYDADYEEPNEPFDMAEILDPTAAEEIAKLAGSYEAAVDKLVDMGLTSQEADKIANELYPEEEEYVEDDDTYNDLRADDFRMNQLDEGFDEEGEDHSMAIEKDLEDRYSRGEITQQTLNNALDYVADHDYDLWADSLDAEYVLQQPGVVEEENIDDEYFERDYDTDYEEPNEPFDMAESLNESKDGSSEGKWKTVTGKDLYAQFKEIDNLNAQEVLIGLDWELEKNPELTKAAAAKIVIKNLKKNPIYYTSTLMSGKEGYEPEYIGGKSANPEAHQMQYLDKNMGNVVDKKRGMQPVKGIEKPKKDSDKGGETNKMEKGISLMSLIAKSTRGVQKMDATGEKMKKIAIKEGQYDFIGHLKAGEEKELRSKIPDVHIEEDTEYGQKINTTISSETKSDEEIKSIVDKIIGMPGAKKDVPGTIFNKNAGITAGLKSLTKDDLMEMIRKEISEMSDGYEPLSREDGSSYTNN
jgi:hypothetical protein